MLFTDLSEKNAQKLCSMHLNHKTKDMHAFYMEHRAAIQRGLFNDIYQSMRFWKILAENIRRSHKNLAYLLRNQYEHADSIYKYVRTHYNRMDPDITQLLRILLSMDCPEMTRYAQDVLSFIILPFLYRNHIYSPLLSLILFIDSMYVLFDAYMDNSLKFKSLQWLGTYHHSMDTTLKIKDIENVPWLSPDFKQIISDEIQLHLDWMKEKRHGK